MDLEPRTLTQLGLSLDLARRLLGPDLLGAYIHGSAVTAGLRPSSDLDVLVVAARPTSAIDKRRLIDGLLPISGSHATAGPARSIELTVVVESDVRPWRYPPTLDFQYGDWLRGEFERGELTPWHSPNPDLAIVLTAARSASVPLVGPPIADLTDPVPREDLVRAMHDELPGLMADLEDDTGNVVLTLARIWTTLEVGRIRSKDAAADWARARLPAEHRPVLARAKAGYRGEAPESWDELLPGARGCAEYMAGEIRSRTT